MKHAVGSLVSARGREWVVLPGSSEDIVMVRPLVGVSEEATGICLALEDVRPAAFELPSPGDLGDWRSCRLLREAVRLGFRSSAGPFRCFGKIAVDPRPYQLVPLLMALKLDPVRILIADSVGVGKSVEACLIARELLDRGEVSRLAVLTPPHLAEQWQGELAEKFHIDAELVLPGTAGRLERSCAANQSLFEVFPFTVISMDYIKSDRRREDFLRTCPEIVIVDEAHTCSWAGEGRSTRHQRHRLIGKLSEHPSRHMILVTAVPHTGSEEAFRSLLSFISQEFADLPEDLAGEKNLPIRKKLAAHFVQRRRGDIESYMDEKTPFPRVEEMEVSYFLSPAYKKLFKRALEYMRGTVDLPSQAAAADTGERHRRRVRWWSALALLRAMASSPEAAAATLRSRAAVADTATSEEADEVGRRTVLDLEEGEGLERMDIVPGSDAGEFHDEERAKRKALLEMAREAEALKGKQDEKLAAASKIVREFVSDGYNPVVFCRFIATAGYLAAELRKTLDADVEVSAVTGDLPPEDRDDRVEKLAKAPKHVLVCTDCLSEGMNLQESFNAVLHYDLSWNPTRHEQREGRVDRFGQGSPVVRIATIYGKDNQIDGIVLETLIRKHRKIKSSLGISVPVPVDTEAVIEAIFEGLLLREQAGKPGQVTFDFDKYYEPRKDNLHRAWDEATERKRKTSQTLFAQQSIRVEEVAAEVRAARDAVGSGVDVENFVTQSLRSFGAAVGGRHPRFTIDLSETPRALRDCLGVDNRVSISFSPHERGSALYLYRTHPFVEALASHTLDAALDPLEKSAARRSGVMRTGIVKKRTTLLIARFRFHIVTRWEAGGEAAERPLLAEDVGILAFEGPATNAAWIDDGAVIEKILAAAPEENVKPEIAADFLCKVTQNYASLLPRLEEEARRRAKELLDAHTRVRKSARIRGMSHRVEPQLPPDILGIFICLPAESST